MLQNHHLLLHIGIDTDTFPDERILAEELGISRPALREVLKALSSPYLDERVPSYSLKGKAIRYDCYSPYK